MDRITVSLLVGMLGAVSLSGAQSDGQYKIYGAGVISCGAWVGERDTRIRAVYWSWAQGFVSGAGFAGGSGRRLRQTDMKGIEMWLDRRCEKDPLLSLASAASELVIELTEKQP